jgi:hypothetical protein
MNENLSDQEFKIIEQPKVEWECELFGCGRALVLHREKGKAPNWFWRWTQFLIFGNKWRKL